MAFANVGADEPALTRLHRIDAPVKIFEVGCFFEIGEIADELATSSLT